MSEAVVANYFIDETGFSFEDDSDAAISDAFIDFAGLLEHVREEGGQTYHAEVIWDVCTPSGRQLTDLLYTPSGIDDDARRLLYGLLQKSRSTEAPPSAAEIASAANSTLPASAGATLCALDLQKQTPAATLTTNQSAIRGGNTVRLPQSDEAFCAYFIIKVEDFKHFWRGVPEACGLSAHAVESVASRAFPGSYFLEDVWSGAKEFEGDMVANRRLLVEHLSGLDDHFLAVFTETNDPNRISAEMGSRAGIDCSKESNKTRRNSKAMATRIRSVDNKNITFEWHTKFEAHRNRIHFAVDDGRLYIGIFCKHLDV